MGSKRRERVEARRADRKEVKLARIEGRTNRVETRQETKQVAYEHGIDPNAAMWEGISSLGQSAASVAGAALAPGKGAMGGAQKGPLGSLLNKEEEPTTQKKSNNMILLVVAAIVVFLFIRKK